MHITEEYYLKVVFNRVKLNFFVYNRIIIKTTNCDTSIEQLSLNIKKRYIYLLVI